MEHKGFTIWFTGLSGSGKSTLAKMLEKSLLSRGYRVEVLDGDVVRTNLSRGLGFSAEDREINILRIAFVAHLLSRNGTIVITAAISPYRKTRKQARGIIGDFLEVYCDASVEDCEKRDVKGLYAKARTGEIKNFTGIDDPYEPPENPEVFCHTGSESKEQSLGRILHTLELMNWIAPETLDGVYAADEEEKIRDRLKQLGYL